MSGPAGARAEPVKNPPRNSSIDSAISAISTRSSLQKASQDGAVGNTEIANLIKTAGSAEAVIQYLLKEKQSQSQQNAQLWRLVDKQRAMILGLNKDLERALKDKEKYRKKLKEVLGDGSDAPSAPSISAPSGQGANSVNVPSAASSSPKEHVFEVPLSPKTLDSDGHKHSPIDVSMAPYPITPPAHQLTTTTTRSTVSDILDPSHTMPRPSEHALDQFDHEEQEREAEAASRRAEESREIPININLPPSRTAPREPPRMPPPRPPVGLPERSPRPEEGASKFPPPPAPPPRKPPPAPLHLRNAKPKPNVAHDEDPETDTDYDHILEVDEMKPDDRRGRRRTREDDEREREILARKEAEFRSLSKKSKKSSSRKATEKPEAPASEIPANPRIVQTTKTLPPREPASLAGVLNGAPDSRAIPSALLSPGLPSSPRPMGLTSPVNSPPLSPLGVSNFPGVPLSPRPPRAPIPFPPNTPLQTPSPAGDPLVLKSPRPLNIIKQEDQGYATPSPTKSSTDSPVERTKVFKGFVTEEYPDLLLPPNALPSIAIRVASSRMKPSRASLISLTQLEEDPVFTLAVYSRADGGELWRIEKDSASLAKLDQRLKQCSAFTARTPDRSLFSGHAPAKLDARRIALNQYLDELLNTPLDNATALELCKYLSTNTLPPNADEVGSSTGEHNAESHKVGPGGRPFRNGYLTKRGKNFGGWKARYFVLDGPLLKYYETPGGAHLGTIKLQKAQIGKQAHHSDGTPAQPTAAEEGENQYRHAFLILEPKKKDPNSVTKHVLCAESDRERDQWVEALLRWIDYRDPDDEEHAKKEHAHDRNGERGHGKKKAHGHAKQQQPQQAAVADENLIGMSYEAAKQGDVPQGVPAKGKQSGQQQQDHESTHSQSTASSYTISAPRDPQVISHSESWGSKLGMGLTPPTQEEKKARKRSFFGFGPKTRTSSDGQDSLFGSDGGNSLPTNQYHGPIRQAFGATLAEAVRYNAPVDVRVPLPAVVYRCIQYLDTKNAIFEEGIFRLSGSNLVIKQLRERFNNEGDINLLTDEQYYDIHAIASLLKLYLRELPSTILTNDLRTQFIAVTEMTNQKEKMAALAELVERLPQANAALLKYLISFLIKIIDHSDVNKMTVRNVGIVFSPTLNIPAPVFAMFLQNYETIFGIDPSEYELPPTEPEYPQERRPSLPASFQERRPSDGRPSTSHSDSPHRQRLMESLDARSTPTPPPMTMQQMAQMNAATLHSRSTPTPPPQRQMNQNHDMGGGHPGMRPAYEGGFAAPAQQQGFDPSHAHMAGGHKANPGYDRPLYENGGLTPAAYEQPYRNRRESAMFMGSLSQQPSKSRLREEAQY
jgi:RalA-binding protein 1